MHAYMTEPTEPTETIMMEEFGLEAQHWPDGWRAERYEGTTLSETSRPYPTLDALKAALTADTVSWVTTG